MDRQLVVDLVELTLNHGLFVVRAAEALDDAETILADVAARISWSSTWTTTTAAPCFGG